MNELENSEIIGVVVDNLEKKGWSIARHLLKNYKDEYFEIQYISDPEYNHEEKRIKLSKEEADLWLKTYLPNEDNYSVIYEEKDVDFLTGAVKKTLYKAKSGRYFEKIEKMNDWDYSILSTIIWLSKEEGKKYSKMPKRYIS